MKDISDYSFIAALILFFAAVIGSGGVIKPFHWTNIYADALVSAGILYIVTLLSAIFSAIKGNRNEG